MHVLVDVDGTLNQLQEHFIRYVSRQGYLYDTSYCDNYDLKIGIVAQSHSVKNKVCSNIFKDDDFWQTVPLIEGAVEGLQFLYDHYDVTIVTAPWDKHNESVKMDWIQRNFPFFPPSHVLFLDKKWLCPGDVIIEDKPSTLETCKSKGFTTIKKVQPYNLDVMGDHHLGSWTEIRGIMETIERKRE